MQLNWERACKLLLDLVEQQPNGKKGAAYDYKKLSGLVRYVYPEAFQGASISQKELLEADRATWRSFLLSIPEEERFQVFEQFAEDLSHHKSQELHELTDLLDLAVQPPPVRREKNIEKLNRYLMRIDGAIYAGRYTLAFKLTNRCLMEYYRAFMRSHQILSMGKKEDINLMSISICRYIISYFRTYRIPYTERRILLITTVTNVLFTTMSNLQSTGSSKFKVDKAIAIYARNNMNRIARFLSRYI